MVADIPVACRPRSAKRGLGHLSDGVVDRDPFVHREPRSSSRPDNHEPKDAADQPGQPSS